MTTNKGKAEGDKQLTISKCVIGGAPGGHKGNDHYYIM